ncbi:transcriptional regulator with PAS, ATPase and Fis domain [Pseudochelatococcus contaminans]|uniref:Transcriptional regulator with PAS, ATPase and Fis domain n=2 Tax=Pseudochelatococcus contaminans TaxID=1538103 RepID=A0A7W5Z6I7_9HYPH|nr:transcriptional regulator with PAS, ATPase and Fis domain [Pseudochelatococcus contaminans]
MMETAKFQSFHVELKASAAIDRSQIEALFAAREFRTVADLSPDPFLVVSPEDTVLFLNDAAHKLAGWSDSRSGATFATFLQQSNLDLDDFLAAAEKGQAQGQVRARSTGRFYRVLRRALSVGTDTRGYHLYWLHDPEGWDRNRRGTGTRSGGRSHQENGETLSFPSDLRSQIDRALKAYARSFRILLLGESGVGKTAIAKHIHASAGDPARPFVHVNCGSIPETLFESEMFGYERGAFTGALQAGKRGYIESAGGGTLFLDEVGEIPLASQAKLLKFLEDSTIQSVGSAVSRRVETNVVAATNRDLHSMMSEGTFRKDLYFRLATFPVNIPPLREREDKDIILDALIARANQERGRLLRLSPDCRATILAHSFPGNLRELRSIVEYLDIVADELAETSDLPEGLSTAPFEDSTIPLNFPAGIVDSLDTSEGTTLKDLSRAFEDHIIKVFLDRYGSKRETARRLGIDIATLVRKTTRTAS